MLLKPLKKLAYLQILLKKILKIMILLLENLEKYLTEKNLPLDNEKSNQFFYDTKDYFLEYLDKEDYLLFVSKCLNSFLKKLKLNINFRPLKEILELYQGLDFNKYFINGNKYSNLIFLTKLIFDGYLHLITLSEILTFLDDVTYCEHQKALLCKENYPITIEPINGYFWGQLPNETKAILIINIFRQYG